MSENIARTPREGLDQQLAELGTLRNAGTRSPSFRAWRQATLTLLQRIGSADDGVSERFRRIPFSPNHNRADANELRNIYEKGCAEAGTVLKELRDRIGDQPWGAVATGGSDSFEVGSTEDDFPTLDLPPGNGGGRTSSSRHPAKRRPKSKPATGRETNLGDLLKEAESKGTRSPAPPLPLAESRVLPPDPDAPASRSKSRRSGPGVKKKDRLKDMLGFGDTAVKLPPAAPSDPPASPVSAAPAASAPPPPPVSAMPPVPPAPPAVMPAVPPTPPVFSAPAAPPPPLTPVASAPPPPIAPAAPIAAPPVAAAPAPVAPPQPVMPVVPSDLLREMEMTPAAVTPPPPPAIEPAPPVAAPPPAKTSLNEFLMTPAFTKRLESLDHDKWTSPDVPGPEELEQGLPPEPVTPPPPPAASPPKRTDVFTAMEAFDTAPPPPAAPPPVTPAPVAQQPVAPPPVPPRANPPAAADPLDPERVTEEFLRLSPVLSSMGTPVRIRKEAEARTGHLVPEAIEILEIASHTHELGVPEGRRAHARAYLSELARCLETHDLPWETLRDTIQFLMEFPPLARRVLPLLLPFLDQAA